MLAEEEWNHDVGFPKEDQLVLLGTYPGYHILLAADFDICINYIDVLSPSCL